MSREVQRLIRKLQPKGPRAFDEQVWPIYVATIVLFAYLAGVVVSLFRFDEPRVQDNAVTWLSLLSVAAVLGLFAIRSLEHRLLKRTVVLSLLLSLIINVSLLVVMAWTSILSRAWQEDNLAATVKTPQETVVVPVYPLHDQNPQQRVPQEHERPVKTGELEAEQRIELTRQETAVQELETTEPREPSDSAAANPMVATKPNRIDTPAAPRQSNAMSKLSRQPLQSPRVPNTPTRAPMPAPSSTPALAAANPTDSRVQPQRPLPATNSESEPSVNPAPSSVAMSRVESQPDAAMRPASLPTFQRARRTPRELPSTTTPVDDRASTAQRVARALEPHSTLLEQQPVTASPKDMVRVDLQPRMSVDVQRQTRMDRPSAETMNRTVERATLATTVPTQTTSTTVETTQRADTQQISQQVSQTSPSNTSVSQQVQQPKLNAATQMPATPSDAPPLPASTLARAEAESKTSVAERLAESTSMVRSRRVTNRATQPNTQVEAVVSADSNLQNPAPDPEPSRMALATSSIGIAGRGDAANLEQGTPSPESPVTIPSASARRAESQQVEEKAFALSPSSRSIVRQSRATAQQPKSSLQALDVEFAMVSGADNPAELAASSAATLERAPSNAANASVTAAKGAADVDLGPTRLATDTGDGRAEGGGQPERNTGELPRALPRANALAGAAGRKTDTTVSAPAARDLASDADTTGLLATAANLSQPRSQPRRQVDAAASPTAELEPTTPSVQVTRSGGARANDDASPAQSVALELATGGNQKPGRRARALQVRTDTASQVPTIASADASAGSRRGDPLDAMGTQARQASVGILSTASEDWGAADAEDLVAGTAEGSLQPVFARQNGGSESEGEVVAASRSNNRLSRSRRDTLAESDTDVELDPEEFAINQPATQQEDTLAVSGSGSEKQFTTVAGGSMQVDLDAEEGLGGLETGRTPDLGVTTRLASPDSEVLSMQPSRFLRRTRPSVSISASTNAVTSTNAFRRRVTRRGEELAGERGLPTVKTEAAIELGLVFLAKYQSDDGSWSFHRFADGKTELPEGEEALIISDTGATGLALLSFLGAGYHHQDDKYQQHVKSGLEFLKQQQRDDGDLYIDQDANSSRSAWLYSHAIATIALCEAYGMTQDPELRSAAQKAINFIEEAQHPTRGGWRYSPAYGADTSVTGWMTMALKSGELAGLTVDTKSFERIRNWLELSQVSETQPFLYRYNPYAADTPSQRHGRKPTRAMTAVGLLMRLYTGWKRDKPDMVLGATTLGQNLPEIGTTDRPRRDTYYWYYATQVMFHMGGEHWQRWNEALHPMLTRSQLQDGALAGSWDPQTPVPDRWGAYGGRLYVTTLNLLSLEVFYRHLPIYEDTSQ